MTVPDQAASALRELEAELLAPTRGGLESVRLAERIRVVRRLLAGEEARWIGTTEAKRLLGLGSEDTVEAWARMRLLQGRRLPIGRLQLVLDDVLRQREVTEALSAIGGDDLTEEELRIQRETRPGTNPWDRGKGVERSQ